MVRRGVCARSLVQDGPNRIAVTLSEDGPVTLNYLDLTLP